MLDRDLALHLGREWIASLDFWGAMLCELDGEGFRLDPVADATLYASGIERACFMLEQTFEQLSEGA